MQVLFGQLIELAGRRFDLNGNIDGDTSLNPSLLLAITGKFKGKTRESVAGFFLGYPCRDSGAI